MYFSKESVLIRCWTIAFEDTYTFSGSAVITLTLQFPEQLSVYFLCLVNMKTIGRIQKQLLTGTNAATDEIPLNSKKTQLSMAFIWHVFLVPYHLSDNMLFWSYSFLSYYLLYYFIVSHIWSDVFLAVCKFVLKVPLTYFNSLLQNYLLVFWE